MKFAITIALAAILFFGCSQSGLDLKHHRGLMGPDTWEITDGTKSVSYYNGDCCCVAEEVMRLAFERLDTGQWSWAELSESNQTFKKAVQPLCDSLKAAQ